MPAPVGAEEEEVDDEDDDADEELWDELDIGFGVGAAPSSPQEASTAAHTISTTRPARIGRRTLPARETFKPSVRDDRYAWRNSPRDSQSLPRDARMIRGPARVQCAAPGKVSCLRAAGPPLSPVTIS